MTDKSHLSDPLGYLYEEIPPEAMAEARKHLAQCPECLKNVKAVRETVKAYRGLPRAEAPKDLKDRLMRRVRDAGKRPAERAAELSPVRTSSREDSAPLLPATIYHEEIEHIESMRRFRWRTWFFHPAWTVAASVVFICAIVIHLSPRRTLWFDEEPRYGNVEVSPSWKDREMTSASNSAAAARPRIAQQPAPPVPVPVPPPQRFELPEAMEKTKSETAPVLPPKVIQNLPPPAASASAATAAPEISIASAPAPAPTLVLEEAEIPSPASPVWVMPDEAVPAAAPPDEANSYSGFQTEDVALADALLGMHRRRGDLGDGGVIVREDAAGAARREPMILDYFSAGEPPPIVERARPIDRDTLALDLVFLAGMQMEKSEFAEAAGTIELLAQLNPEKAGELLVMLDRLATVEESKIDFDTAVESSTTGTPPEAAAEAPSFDEPPEDPPPPDLEPAEATVDETPVIGLMPEPDVSEEPSEAVPDDAPEAGVEGEKFATESNARRIDGNARTGTPQRITEIVGGVLGVGLGSRTASEDIVTPAGVGEMPETDAAAGSQASPVETNDAESAASIAAESPSDLGFFDDETLEENDGPASSEAIDDSGAVEAEEPADEGADESGAPESDGATARSPADLFRQPLFEPGSPGGEPAGMVYSVPSRPAGAAIIFDSRRSRPFSTDPYIRGD